MSIGTTIAAELVPENRRASAISTMFYGITLATVTGVPLGTLIGQEFGWRVSFAAIVGLGILALLANMALIPAKLRRGTPASLNQQLKLFKNGRIMLSYAISCGFTMLKTIFIIFLTRITTCLAVPLIGLT